MGKMKTVETAQVCGTCKYRKKNTPLIKKRGIRQVLCLNPASKLYNEQSNHNHNHTCVWYEKE
jgi:hypothetical protein